jgi:protease-4
MSRGAKLVFTLIVVAVIVSVVTSAGAFLMLSVEPTVREHSTLVQRVRGTLAETEPSGLVSQFIVSPPTVRGIVDNLRKAKVDDRIGAVVLAPGDIGALWGKVQEIRDAVLDFKTSGKPIVAHLEFGGDQEYFLATACDKIFLTPASPLDVNGLSMTDVFVRGTLEKIGAEPQLLHIGEYKTAANTFTERGYTPAHREMSESLNGDLYEQLVRAIADGRNKSEEEARALLDQGPFLAEDAVRHGLVDDLAYEDQLDDLVEFPGGSLRRVESERYTDVSPASVGLGTGPRIAVIYAVGTIASGESSYDGGEQAVVGSDTLVRWIRTARADDGIRAIVLRVDSPGGSAVASDVIWREVLLTRNSKPVIASMSDLAASGGYYIAMPAHQIVAQPGTLTGSIGVVTGKIVTAGTFDKLGISFDSVQHGQFAEINSPLRPYSPAERQKIEEQMQATYDAFVEKAAQARHTTPERIDAIAQGRVWTGKQAKDLGLVDELGGLSRALALAKQKAGIADDQEVDLVIYPPRRSIYEVLSNPFTAAAHLVLERLLGPTEARVLSAVRSPLQLFRRGEPLALMPHVWLR